MQYFAEKGELRMNIDKNEIRKHFAEILSLENIRCILHISKRKAAWMLRNGIIKCEILKKNTRCYQVKIEDFIESASGTYGYHLELYANDIECLTSNGKGVDADYALASAYAELYATVVVQKSYRYKPFHGLHNRFAKKTPAKLMRSLTGVFF